MGGALITPAMLAILIWTFTGHPRTAAIGILSTSAGVGMAAGPVLAGFLLDHFWWGSVFLINAPVAASGLAGPAVFVLNFRSPTPRERDPTGMLLSRSGLVALASGLIRAGQVATGSDTSSGNWPAYWRRCASTAIRNACSARCQPSNRGTTSVSHGTATSAVGRQTTPNAAR